MLSKARLVFGPNPAHGRTADFLKNRVHRFPLTWPGFHFPCHPTPSRLNRTLPAQFNTHIPIPKSEYINTEIGIGRIKPIEIIIFS
ncbi:hypothetical protein BN2475_30065 [Paraburkholderia ribeironis]|uniref:Uncharacterized protein n=1 Tax=Paraburkholderia ribeironis TaxID=1247936 RepID=A0A1N7RIZ3_9BURK|nr:hypothetical protein BN2475_30065 [Paraburkholderia ribeironis]